MQRRASARNSSARPGGVRPGLRGNPRGGSPHGHGKAHVKAHGNVRGDNLRRVLAQEAARIMAQHGIHDYLTAKRKAAERLAFTDFGALPSNTEIEAALVE